MEIERRIIKRIDCNFFYNDEYYGELDILFDNGCQYGFAAKGEKFVKIGRELFSIFPFALNEEIIGEEVEIVSEKIQLSEDDSKITYFSITSLSTSRTYIFPIENENKG